MKSLIDCMILALTIAGTGYLLWLSLAPMSNAEITKIAGECIASGHNYELKTLPRHHEWVLAVTCGERLNASEDYSR